ncbi:YdeI/OmpD-associated family protein [Actinokineospora sp. HUAS TT18]|uniref:YdeI/OmpD-associated family protein n=1 Tax=Actinokineospora sp. HUAS TT18 TaxID=3447451 RepID=UPI003F521CB5
MTEPTITCRDAAEWESWLSANHDSQTGVWLKIAKKHSGVASVTITEALDGALCFGWIDGQRRALDSQYYLQRYCPRRPKGTWSQVNVAKVEALTAAGRMRPSGLAEVSAAKADGRWAGAYASQREATVPDDLAEALRRNERAARAFEALDRTNRYAVLLDLMKARTPKTRAARLDRAVAALAYGGEHEH